MDYVRAGRTIGLWIGMASICTTGCREVTSRSGPRQSASTSYEAVIDASDERYKVDAKDVVDQPVLIEEDDQKLEYPPSLLALNLPVEDFVVKVVISSQGVVTDCNLTSVSDKALSAATREVFLDVIRQFVFKWHFMPLTIHKQNRSENGDASMQMPFSLRYSFRFEVVNGKPAVNLSPQISPPIGSTDW